MSMHPLHRARIACALVLGLWLQSGAAATLLFQDQFDGPDRWNIPNPEGTALQGWFWRASKPLAPSAPAVVMLHGCSGVYGSNGYGDDTRISSRFIDWALRLNAAGVHVLLLDSFSTRDPQQPPAQARQNYCNDRAAVVAIGAREETDRPRDALAAYQALLALRNGNGSAAVDPARVGLLGWSHGGSAVLAAVGGALPAQPFATAQSFYPGCGMYGAFGNPGNGTSTFLASVPTAVYLGLDDSISVAAACNGHRVHSDNAGGDTFIVNAFENTGHSFDGARCVVSPAGAHLSPWTGKRYTCSGSYEGVPFDLYDWRAKIESDRLATCALMSAFGVAHPTCGGGPIFP